MEQIKSVMSEEHTESTEQTYDIYLLPPGEDPETCQSYLRMRNKDGKYNLMFEVCPNIYPTAWESRVFCHCSSFLPSITIMFEFGVICTAFVRCTNYCN